MISVCKTEECIPKEEPNIWNNSFSNNCFRMLLSKPLNLRLSQLLVPVFQQLSHLHHMFSMIYVQMMLTNATYLYCKGRSSSIICVVIQWTKLLHCTSFFNRLIWMGPQNRIDSVLNCGNWEQSYWHTIIIFSCLLLRIFQEIFKYLRSDLMISFTWFIM